MYQSAGFCVFVYTCIYVCLGVHISMETRGQSQVLSILVFWDRTSETAVLCLELTKKARLKNWWMSDLPGRPFSARIKRTWTLTPGFLKCVFWWLKSGPCPCTLPNKLSPNSILKTFLENAFFLWLPTSKVKNYLFFYQLCIWCVSGYWLLRIVLLLHILHIQVFIWLYTILRGIYLGVQFWGPCNTNELHVLRTYQNSACTIFTTPPAISEGSKSFTLSFLEQNPI